MWENSYIGDGNDANLLFVKRGGQNKVFTQPLSVTDLDLSDHHKVFFVIRSFLELGSFSGANRFFRISQQHCDCCCTFCIMTDYESKRKYE